MKGKESALYSHYIIDGLKCDMTPAELLDECMHESDGILELPEFDDIIDEPTEAPLSLFTPDSSKHEEYLEQTLAASNEERQFMMLYPEHFTRMQIAKTLMGRLWSEGHFRLGDLRLWAQWEWNTRHIGNMAAFYASAAAASEYIYGLGISLEDYVFIEGDEGSTAKFFAWLPEAEDEENIFKTSPYESTHPWISESRKCPGHLVYDPRSWIIYIPFDTCRYKLGGSLLAQENNDNGGKASDINDPDYFIDCYEVVRELVEDGFVLSGCTIADGGLITAARGMCSEAGMDIDIKGIMSSYQEERHKVLFGEVPGVLIQVSDENYDYVDSQLLLQDIAYYPIGHPTEGPSELRISEDGKSDVADILASLLGHASEGED